MPFDPRLGGCVPAVCFKVEFDATNAFVVTYAAGVANPKKAKGADIQALYKQDLLAFKATLKTVRQGCDGCRCIIHNPNPPWTAAPEQQIGTFDNGAGIVAVDGVQVKWYVGTCVAENTKIKPAGGQWMDAGDYEKKYFSKAPGKKKKKKGHGKRGGAVRG